MKWGQRREKVTRIEHRKENFHFDDFDSGVFLQHPKRSDLFTPQKTHFLWLHNKEPWGELIYPRSPGGTECVCACGDSGCVFNASLLGGSGMQFVSGSGHIQYRGITPGSSEEMRSLSSSSCYVSLWWIKQITRPKSQPRCNVCLALLGGKKS